MKSELPAHIVAMIEEAILEEKESEPIVLETKHFKVCYVDDRCTVCDGLFKVRYRFAKTSRGLALLCEDCKTRPWIDASALKTRCDMLKRRILNLIVVVTRHPTPKGYFAKNLAIPFHI